MKPMDVKKQLVLSLFPYVLNEPIDRNVTLKLASEQEPQFVMQLARLYRDVFAERELSFTMALALFSTRTHQQQAKQLLHELIETPEDALLALHLYLQQNGKPLSNGFKKTLGECFQLFEEIDFQHIKTQCGTVDLADFLRLIHPQPLTEEQRVYWGTLLQNKEKRTLDTYRDIHQIVRQYNAQTVRSMIEKTLPSSLFHLFETLLFLEKRGVKVDPMVLDALEERFKKNMNTLPILKGKTFLASDISASMNQPLSPTRFTTYRQIATFCMLGAAWQCEQAIPSFYASDFAVLPQRYQEGFLETFVRMEQTELGHQNDAKQAIHYLLENALFVERILLFSDKPSLHEEVEDALKTYQETINSAVHIHLFYLAGERGKVYKQENIHYYSGWNDWFYPLLFFIEQTPEQIVTTIEAYEKPTSF